MNDLIIDQAKKKIIRKLPLPKKDPIMTELIEITEHKALAEWAIDCLERFMPVLEKKYPDEQSPRNAVNILKMWINNEITMWEARKHCWKVLEFARKIEDKDKVSCQIARACSHTLAVCHVPTHAEGVTIYTVSALQYMNIDKKNVNELMQNEKQWQINHLKEISK